MGMQIVNKQTEFRSKKVSNAIRYKYRCWYSLADSKIIETVSTTLEPQSVLKSNCICRWCLRVSGILVLVQCFEFALLLPQPNWICVNLQFAWTIFAAKPHTMDMRYTLEKCKAFEQQLCTQKNAVNEQHDIWRALRHRNTADANYFQLLRDKFRRNTWIGISSSRPDARQINIVMKPSLYLLSQ